MQPVSRTQVFMVTCLLAVCVLLMGAHAAPHHGGKRVKKDHNTVHLLLNTSMPNNLPIRSYSNSSLSPWEYRFSHDENRFPQDIAEARCMYTGCLTMSGEEDLDLQSKPIHRQILVLRRVADGDRPGYIFQLEYKTVVVGCTCVRPHILYH